MKMSTFKTLKNIEEVETFKNALTSRQGYAIIPGKNNQSIMYIDWVTDKPIKLMKQKKYGLLFCPLSCETTLRTQISPKNIIQMTMLADQQLWLVEFNMDGSGLVPPCEFCKCDLLRHY